MEGRLSLLILLFILNSCVHSDDADEICESDCTTMKGRFVTKDDAPLPGAKIAIHFDPDYVSLSGKSRTIAEARTDSNGNYNMQFYLRDNEIGEEADGFLRVTVDVSNLDTDIYLVAKNIQLGEAIYSVGTRDTVIDQSYYFPTKAFIRVDLNNFVPVQEGDRFEVQTLFPYGLKVGNNDYLDTEYRTGLSDFDAYKADGKDQSFDRVIVAENEENVIRIIKIKDGVAEPEEIKLFVPENNTIELAYEY